MKKLSYSVLAIMIMFAACAPSNNEDELVIPQEILQPDEMVDVLTDMQLAEGALLLKRSHGQPYKKDQERYFNLVFEKHGITQEYFEESLSFYKNHLYKLDEIYNKVIKNLESLRKEVSKADKK